MSSKRQSLSARNKTVERINIDGANNIDRPHTAHQQCSITYNPFKKIKSELSLDTENLTHRKNHKNITPRTRYNTLKKYASLHSLNINKKKSNNRNNRNNRNNKGKIMGNKHDLIIPPLIPKFNKNSKCKKYDDKSSLSSLSLHSQIQNDTTSVWFNVLTSRYSRKKEDKTIHSSLADALNIDETTDLHQFASNQQKQINTNLQEINHIFNVSKHRHSSKSNQLIRPKSQPILKPFDQNKNHRNLKRAQTASNLHKKRRRNNNENNINLESNKDLIQIELDRKLNHLRKNKENRSDFQLLVQKIKQNRSKRNSNTNYLISNKKLASSYSKDILLKNAQKANNKWYRNSVKMKLHQINKNQLLEIKKEAFDNKLKEMENETRKSLFISMRKQKIEEKIKFKHFQQKQWIVTLVAFKRIEAILTLYNRMNEILKLRQKQHESVKIIEHFYRKYIVAKRRYNDQEIIKLFQRSLRIYAVKYNFNHNIESSIKILLFLKQLNKIQGLVSCVEKLDLNGRSIIIQTFWRKHYLIIQCQKNLMFKHFKKYEDKYIISSNKKFSNNKDSKTLEIDKKRHENLKQTSISSLPTEFIENEINSIYWKIKIKYKIKLRKWIQKYNSWKISYDKQINAAKLKQQIGIKVNVKYDPPSKPSLNILMKEKEIIKWIKDLHNKYLLKQSKIIIT